MKTDKKAIIVGCAKDCAKSIANVLSNIDSIADLFGEIAFIFVENDSRDGTKHVLESWGKGKDRFILVSMDGLNFCPGRTVRLAIARNTYLALLNFEWVNARHAG